MSIIRVRFDGSGRIYPYWTDLPVEVGQRVVVESPYDGYVAVTVTEVGATGNASKEVVCIIDDRRYLARVEARKRIAAIHADLAYRLKNRVTVTDEMRREHHGDQQAQQLLNEIEDLTHVLEDRPDLYVVAMMEQSGIDVSGLIDEPAQEEGSSHAPSPEQPTLSDDDAAVAEPS